MLIFKELSSAEDQNSHPGQFARTTCRMGLK